MPENTESNNIPLVPLAKLLINLELLDAVEGLLIDVKTGSLPGCDFVLFCRI